MLIRGGTVVTADGERKSDVLVRAGQVAEVREGIASGEDVIDATGMLVLPGVVDPHTHLLLDTGTARTADDFESGSASAAAGVDGVVQDQVMRAGLGDRLDATVTSGGDEVDRARRRQVDEVDRAPRLLAEDQAAADGLDFGDGRPGGTVIRQPGLPLSQQLLRFARHDGVVFGVHLDQ